MYPTQAHTYSQLSSLCKLAGLCEPTSRINKLSHSQTHQYQHLNIFWALLLAHSCSKSKRRGMLLFCIALSPHTTLCLAVLHVWVSIWSHQLCICKASIALIFSHAEPLLQRALLKPTDAEHCLFLFLSLWPFLTASVTFSYVPIRKFPCSHSFSLSSLNQSVSQDVVPLEPWSIAVEHKGTGERERGPEEWKKKWTFALYFVLINTAWAISIVLHTTARAWCQQWQTYGFNALYINIHELNICQMHLSDSQTSFRPVGFTTLEIWNSFRALALAPL